MVEVAVAYEPVGGAHERPGLNAQIEADLPLGNSPVGLDGCAGIALHRNGAMLH